MGVCVCKIQYLFKCYERFDNLVYKGYCLSWPRLYGVVTDWCPCAGVGGGWFGEDLWSAMPNTSLLSSHKFFRIYLIEWVLNILNWCLSSVHAEIPVTNRTVNDKRKPIQANQQLHCNNYELFSCYEIYLPNCVCLNKWDIIALLLGLIIGRYGGGRWTEIDDKTMHANKAALFPTKWNNSICSSKLVSTVWEVWDVKCPISGHWSRSL